MGGWFYCLSKWPGNGNEIGMNVVNLGLILLISSLVFLILKKSLTKGGSCSFCVDKQCTRCPLTSLSKINSNPVNKDEK